MAPLLSILVPCLSSRNWRPLVAKLNQQASPFGGEVEVVHIVDSGKMTSGAKRNKLVDQSYGEYRCFVDDDDDVTIDYVYSLLEGCRTGADVVAFDVLFSHLTEGREEKWKLGAWPNDRANGRMCLNHLCAWRKSLADRVRWCESLGHGDDALWAQPLYHSLPSIKVHHCDFGILYNYRYDVDVTANQAISSVDKSAAYFGDGLKCYLTETGGILIQDGAGSSFVRDRFNFLYPVHSNIYYHTVLQPK